MLHKNSVWQSSFSNWQPRFIQENLLPLGHTAWQEFLNQGRGMVICNLAIRDILSVNWSLDLVEYKAYFIAESKVAAYLQLFNLEAKAIALLRDRVQNYNPETELLLLINQNGHIEINMLQNMAVSPTECYRQIQQRQSEFQLDHFTTRRNF